MVDYERPLYAKRVNNCQSLRIVALVDRKDWVVTPVHAGESVSGIVLTINEGAYPHFVPKPAISKTFIVSTPKQVKLPSPRFKNSPGIVTSKEPPNTTLPYPYTVYLDAYRTNRLKQREHVGQWTFSGELKVNSEFHFRTDAVLELAKDDDDTPYHVDFTIRVRSRRSLRTECVNTASSCLNIGEDLYEFVSKEILALNSEYFNVFYYGSFAEAHAANTTPCKMSPIYGEDPQDFAVATSLLLRYAHHRTLENVTPLNAVPLIQIAERYQFCSTIVQRIDAHLSRYVRYTDDKYMLDEALLMAKKFGLYKTADNVINKYKSANQLAELVDRQMDRLTAETLAHIFHVYKQHVAATSYQRCCHVFFEFADGRVIIQLNRVGLPVTTLKVLDEMSQAPKFFWDYKHRLMSAEPFGTKHRYNGESADKYTVPEGAWAFVLREKSGKGIRLMLAKNRPDGVYLGFVVQGESILKTGSNPSSAGMLYVA